MSLRMYANVLMFLTLGRALSRADLKSYGLNDGNRIPAVALGTSLGHQSDGVRNLPVDHSVANAVQWALEAGYKHIDTASIYRTEHEVGRGVRTFLRSSGAKREDVYITTKLWNDAHETNQVIPALQKSLDTLNMDYVDLYLVHYPMAYTETGEISNTDYLDTWRGMEMAKKQNLARSIGVSNFNLTQMKRLWKKAKIKPAVLQIEVNPTITQEELVEWCNDHDVVVMAYSPFGVILGRKPTDHLTHDNPVLRGIAQKYNKTVPQVLIRYLLERRMVPIPRSTNKERINENINVFDFKLTAEEVRDLSAFNANFRLRTPAKWYPHPHFPFEKKNLTAMQIQYIIEHSLED